MVGDAPDEGLSPGRGARGGPARRGPSRRGIARGRRGAADRVRRSHEQTRRTLRLALAFLAAAALVAVVGGDRWSALHLFLSGAVVLAISGVSLMLTVTWSAAPAPSDRWVALQRYCVALGAAAVVVGWSTTAAPQSVVVPAAGLYVVGLVVLAGLLAVTLCRSVERRFVPAVVAYLAALAAGVAAVALGAAMAIDAPSPSLRGAHIMANLLGLVGFTVGGTLPFFAGTVVRSRLSRRATPRRLLAVLAGQVGALSLAVVGVLLDAGAVTATGLGAYALGVVAVLTSMPGPTRRQLRWAGPRMVALWLGGAWWAAAVAVAAVDAATDGGVTGGASPRGLSGTVVAVLAVAAYGQILWGSLAYLLPMLRGGGHERLSEGFATTRSWLGLVAVNVAGVALVAPWSGVAVVALAVWVVDFAWRAARVGTARSPRPSRVAGE